MLLLVRHAESVQLSLMPINTVSGNVDRCGNVVNLLQRAADEAVRYVLKVKNEPVILKRQHGEPC